MNDLSGTLDFSGGPYAEPANWLPRLHKLVGDQLLLAQRLLSHADDLDASAAEADDERLEDVLEQREAVIREMLLIGEDLRPLLERFTQLATGLRTTEQQVVQERVLELDTLLEQVAQRDGGVQRTLEGRRGQIARALAGVQTARSAASAYGGSGLSAAPQARDLEV